MRTIPFLLVLVGCGQVVDPNDGDDDAIDIQFADSDPSTPEVPPAPTGIQTAVAPSAENPMYQGTQRLFKTTTGTCRGRVAASMGWGGFCYLAANDHVMCSGVIGDVDYGMTMTDTGQTGVEQIMVFFFSDGMCVTGTDHTVRCMASTAEYGSNHNAFGNTLTSSFTQWTERTDFAAIASGTWDQICGITTDGQVYCGGLFFGLPPVAVGDPGQSSLWVDTSGSARLSDSFNYRPGEGRAECQVSELGLLCAGQGFGPQDGSTVTGVTMGPGGPMDTRACWLDDKGDVMCTGGHWFEKGKTVFLAADYYTDSLCAIYNDGSIWCVGSNTNGKLGTGDSVSLWTETMVAPPGSAMVQCE